MSEHLPPEALDAWAAALRELFGLDAEDIPIPLILDLARDVAVGVDQALKIHPVRIEFGAPRLALWPRPAFSRFPRPAHPGDRGRDADPKPIGGMPGG